MILPRRSGFSFAKYLAEANAAGSGFEQRTADAVGRWLESAGLGRKWSAKRFQRLSEDGGARDEDYSDVVVEERRTGRRFFVECKEYERSNVLNLQFDIGRDGGIRPVKGRGREPLAEAEASAAARLVDAVRSSEGFKEFVAFLNERNRLLKNLRPGDFWEDEGTEDAERLLLGLIKAYNRLVDAGKTEADCKKFDAGEIRGSTANTALCALCWRLSDPSRTWDICRVSDVPDMGAMVRRHYGEGKASPAAYIQFGEDALFALTDENPLGLEGVPPFPERVEGEFSLKFTPRFGTGAVYVTPRSEITSEMSSPFTFLDEKRWPKAEGGR